MQKDYTHLVFLLDRSGSMENCWRETVNGLKVFVDEQKKVNGKLTVSLYVFDSIFEKKNDFTDIKENDLNLDGVKPRGSTALYDSFVKAVDEVGSQLNKLPKSLRPEKVSFVTLTDGGENASQTAKLPEVKNKLAHQRDVYSWDFTFLGADFDANQLAATTGLDVSCSVNYSKSATADSFGKLSRSFTNYRTASLNAKKNVAEYMNEKEEVVN